MKYVKLSWKFLLQDLKKGELKLLIVALFLAISVSTALTVFSARLQLIFGQQVVQVLGADLILSGNQPPRDIILNQINKFKLQSATFAEFPTMAVFNDTMNMVSIKAVGDNYPLRGFVSVNDNVEGIPYKTSQIPNHGQAWLDSRLFQLLGIKIGEEIQIGNIKLQVSKVIVLETDRGFGFANFSPRVMINIDDIEASGLIQIGSRVHWKTQLTGINDNLNKFQIATKPLLNPTEEITSIKTTDKILSRSTARLNDFFGLGSIATIILSGIAITMAVQRFSYRHFKNIAIMRCLGAYQNTSTKLVLIELLIIVSVVTVPSIIVGVIFQNMLAFFISPILPWLPKAGALPYIIGGLTGFIILIGFGLSPMLGLNGISPLNILKKIDQIRFSNVKSVYILSILTITCLFWYQSNNIIMTLVIITMSMLMYYFLSLCLKLFFHWFDNKVSTSMVPLNWKFSLKRILLHNRKMTIQIIAFSLTFMAIAVILILKNNIIARWQNELPENLPNYFALGIQTNQLSEIKKFINDYNIESSEIYPIVRAKIIQINGLPLSQVLTKTQASDNAVNRELNLTYTDQIPILDTLKKGNWWHHNTEKKEVSVEEGLAKRLNLKLGDKVTFNVSGLRFLEAEITNIRMTNWINFKPSFYMILPRNVLKDLPTSWLNSFYIEDSNKNLINKFVTQFPTVTLFDLDSIITQVRSMIIHASFAIEIILILILFAGSLVLIASIQSSVDERLYENALLRSLGASKKIINRVQMTEFILIGFISGILSLFSSEVISFWLQEYVFNMRWKPSYILWLATPLASICFITTIGMLSTRKIIKYSPTAILKTG